MTPSKLFNYVIFFSVSLCHGQVRERMLGNDLERYKLNGSVKNLTYIEYEPQYSNDSTYILKISDFFSMVNNSVTFTKEGLLEKKIELSADINDSLSTSAIWTYKYDNKKRLVEELRLSKKYGDSTIWTYDYSEKNTTLVKQFDKTYHVLYFKYVQNKEIELLKTANSDSSYQCKVNFIYDKSNRLIRKEDFQNKDSIVYLRILNYKDKSRNYNSETIEEKNKFKITKNFKYDFNGNTKEIFDSNFKLTGWFEYIYDNRKNWIEKKCYNASGRIYNIYKRKITYY